MRVWRSVLVICLHFQAVIAFITVPQMAENNDSFSVESQTDANLTNFEKKCLEEFEKDPLASDENLTVENERLNERAWSNFQNAASAVSNLYRGTQTVNCPLWPLFQTAANNTTTLYKESLDLMRKSFELGSRYGDYRQKKEILSWARKKRRLIPREEVIGYICGKPVPSNWHRTSTPYRGNRQELSSPRINWDDVNDVNLQLFKEASFQGRRSSQSGNFPLSPARGMDEYHGCFTRDKKRLHADCRTGSPSHKRAKLCVMETDEF